MVEAVAEGEVCERREAGEGERKGEGVFVAEEEVGGMKRDEETISLVGAIIFPVQPRHFSVRVNL